MRLFDRVGRRLILTAQGEQLLVDCRRVLTDLNSVRERADVLRRGDSGALKVLAPPQTLRRPLPTKDGGTLRTVADAANYIVALPKDRRRSHWDRTVQLLLDMADPSDISRQLELALFYDRQLNFKTPPQHSY